MFQNPCSTEGGMVARRQRTAQSDVLQPAQSTATSKSSVLPWARCREAAGRAWNPAGGSPSVLGSCGSLCLGFPRRLAAVHLPWLLAWPRRLPAPNSQGTPPHLPSGACSAPSPQVAGSLKSRPGLVICLCFPLFIPYPLWRVSRLGAARERPVLEPMAR